MLGITRQHVGGADVFLQQIKSEEQILVEIGEVAIERKIDDQLENDLGVPVRIWSMTISRSGAST